MSIEFENLLYERIYDAFLKAAALPEEQPGVIGKLTIDSLQNGLPEEHRKAFNVDMEKCLVLTTQSLFDLSPQTLATNILPVFARFQTTLIMRALINYHPNGTPIMFEIEVSPEYHAVASIKWAFSIANEAISDPPP